MRDAINAAVKVAMKAKDERRTTTLRMMNAKIKDADIAARPTRDKVTDPEVVELLGKMVKQRRESMEAFTKGGRPELALAEEAEIAIIQEFLPQGLSEAEAADAIARTVASLDARTIKDMGRVMAALKEHYAGQMDFAKASAIVKGMLK